MESFANTFTNMSMNTATFTIVLTKTFENMSMNPSAFTTIFTNMFTSTNMNTNTITASTWTRTHSRTRAWRILRFASVFFGCENMGMSTTTFTITFTNTFTCTDMNTNTITA